MYSSSARGSHIFCPTTAKEPTLDEADDHDLEDDSTIVNPPASAGHQEKPHLLICENKLQISPNK
jgi:hypothetical protein